MMSRLTPLSKSLVSGVCDYKLHCQFESATSLKGYCVRWTRPCTPVDSEETDEDYCCSRTLLGGYCAFSGVDGYCASPDDCGATGLGDTGEIIYLFQCLRNKCLDQRALTAAKREREAKLAKASDEEKLEIFIDDFSQRFYNGAAFEDWTPVQVAQFRKQAGNRYPEFLPLLAKKLGAEESED